VAGSGFLPSGFVAVGLTYSFQFTNYMKMMVKVLVTLETQMSSAERIKEYVDKVEQEPIPDAVMAKPIINPSTLPKDWPSRGEIVAKNIKLRYRKGPIVLKGIDFHIKSNEKIGIAGRTG
jgi:ABC-type multidrug transport system fused ATPase/permease subunit